LAFEKHGQFAGNLAIVGQEDRTGMGDELCGRIEELEHGRKTKRQNLADGGARALAGVIARRN